MISTSLEAIQRQPILAKPLKKAIEFLTTNNLKQLKAGNYEIVGKDVFAQVIDFTPAKREDVKAESHIHYIDLQYLVTGNEKLGFIINNGEYKYDEYLDERDLCLYNRKFENESYTIASPSSINIFFPEDIHMPGIKVNEKRNLRKIVIKIKVDYYNNQK